MTTGPTPGPDQASPSGRRDDEAPTRPIPVVGHPGSAAPAPYAWGQGQPGPPAPTAGFPVPGGPAGPAWGGPPPVDAFSPTGPPGWGPPGNVPPAEPLGSGPGYGAQPARSRGLGAGALAAVAALVVAIVAVVVVLVVRPFGGTAAPSPSPTPTAGPGTSSAASTGSSVSTPDPATTPAPASVVTVTSVQTVSATPDPGPGTTPAAGLAGLTERSLDCSAGSGYLVQLASELDEAAFVRRVEGLRSAGQLPAGAAYLTAQGDCDLFTVQDNLWVLYSGPFATVEQACPDRLAGPVDGFVKGATQATKATYVGCVCVTASTALPALSVGSTGQWVGELHRALRVKLDYDVGDLDTDPSRWGVFSDRTAAAVGEVQTAAGLPVTGAVDTLTWEAIQFGACRG